MFKIKFDSIPSKYWSTKTKIEFLERRIIVSSIQYYELNQTVIEDYMYDGISQQLVELINESPKEFEKTRYYYCFKEFDGSTGFDLPRKLNRSKNINNPGGMSDYEYLLQIAQRLLKFNRKLRR